MTHNVLFVKYIHVTGWKVWKNSKITGLITTTWHYYDVDCHDQVLLIKSYKNHEVVFINSKIFSNVICENTDGWGDINKVEDIKSNSLATLSP